MGQWQGEAPPKASRANTRSGRFRRVIHETIQKVTHDIEHDFHFNTAISAVMELVNALHDFERTSLDGMARQGAERACCGRRWRPCCSCFGPVSPHITEELWGRPRPSREPLQARVARRGSGRAHARRGGDRGPGGRARAGRLTATVGAQEAEIREMALADGKVLPWLDGRQVAKVVVVPAGSSTS